MRKVTTINLNNNAYQIDEEGYEALREYLAAAERNLEGNPDRSEILADLEQAIGDKCRTCLGAHKTVVSADEVRRILEEMGPVESSAPGTTGAGTSGATPGATPGVGASYGAPFPRRMYRLQDGRMWGGVCTGLAAYFGVDVVWMRVAFILLTIFTSGVWILIYIAMCFIVPVADTAEERAAAHGAPFNAHELINRVKKNSSGFRSRGPRMSRSAWWTPHSVAPGPYAAPVPSPGYAARITGGILLPVMTVLSALWFAALLVAGVAFWTLHGDPAFPWQQGTHDWSSGAPQWLVFIVLVVIWSMIAIPLGAGRRAALYYANGGRPHGWADAWSALLWTGIVVVLSIIAWQYLPGVQEALRGLILSAHGTTFT